MPGIPVQSPVNNRRFHVKQLLNSADARREAQAQHGEGGEVDLGIAVGVGVMLFNLELALVVKQTVQYKGSITVGTFNRQAVEGGVVIGREGVKLQGEVAESGAVGLLEDPAWQREALPVACGALALAPACGGVEVRDRAHQFRQGAPLRLFGQMPVPDPLELLVSDVGGPAAPSCRCRGCNRAP